MNTRQERGLRRALKLSLLKERGDLCELCKLHKATDLHELVPRSRVLVEHRAALYVPALCFLLCRECNMIADTDVVRLQLAHVAAGRYGRETIAMALLELEIETGTRLGVRLEQEHED